MFAASVISRFSLAIAAASFRLSTHASNSNTGRCEDSATELDGLTCCTRDYLEAVQETVVSENRNSHGPLLVVHICFKQYSLRKQTLRSAPNICMTACWQSHPRRGGPFEAKCQCVSVSLPEHGTKKSDELATAVRTRIAFRGLRHQDAPAKSAPSAQRQAKFATCVETDTVWIPVG